MIAKQRLGILVIGLGLALVTWAGWAGWREASQSKGDSARPPASATPLWQVEPLVPTAAPPSGSNGSSADFQPAMASPALLPADARRRFGVGVPFPPLSGQTESLSLGWYLAWQVIEAPARPGQLEFWQMVRVREEGYHPDEATIRRVAWANPGSIWLIGNEPDVIWQDNVSPARYAHWYHQLYQLIKSVDPTSQVAIGGITQPTPLRLTYLEMVLAAYESEQGQPMPVDIWNIHNFILPEKRGSWGVDIPPGLAVAEGASYEMADHDDLAIFQRQLLDFRRWMAAQGQRDKGLIISEYGILMPADYGFGPERVRNFLYGTYNYMLTARDAEVGYPADDNRLVQRWAWYSLSDDRYPTGNFIDFNSGQLTELGRAHQAFVAQLP